MPYLTSFRMHFSGPILRQNFVSWTQYCKWLNVRVGPFSWKCSSTSHTTSFLLFIFKPSSVTRREGENQRVGLKKRWVRDLCRLTERDRVTGELEFIQWASVITLLTFGLLRSLANRLMKTIMWHWTFPSKSQPQQKLNHRSTTNCKQLKIHNSILFHILVYSVCSSIFRFMGSRRQKQ